MNVQLQQYPLHFSGQGWQGDIEKHKEAHLHRDNAKSLERTPDSFWKPAQESTRWLSLVTCGNEKNLRA